MARTVPQRVTEFHHMERGRANRPGCCSFAITGMSVQYYHVLVCRGPQCAGVRQADPVYERLQQLIAERGMQDRVVLGRQNCFGRCSRGPNVYVRGLPGKPEAGRGGESDGLGSVWQLVSPAAGAAGPRPPSALYHGVGQDDLADIVDQHLNNGRVIVELTRRSAYATGDNPPSWLAANTGTGLGPKDPSGDAENS